MIIEIHIPNIGEEELEVTEIMVKTEDHIDINQPLLVLESDKSSVEVPSLYQGIVKNIIINVGDKVKTGSLVMILESIKTTKQHDSIQHTSVNVNDTKNIIHNNVYETTIITEQQTNHTKNIHATPLIRQIARTFGINLNNIQGSGRKGRILREDIQNYIKNTIHYTESTSSNKQKPYLFNTLPWPKINFENFGNIEKIKLTKIQQISGANLHRNWITLPHVTQFDEADITELEQFRKQKNEEALKKQSNLKITPIIFIIKAVAKALEELPYFNSSLSEDGQTLILKKYINIGIAVNTAHGLIVPVIKDANKKNITKLTQELSEILKKTSSSGNKLTPFDMQGGCFTISSLGKIGGTAFTPIINVPEVAILGISKSSIKPIWNGTKFIPRVMLPLALSYDHRVINGVDGARFMNIINTIISDIRHLIM